MGRCKNCKQKFEAKVFLQKFCFKTECVSVFLQSVKEDKAKKEKKAWSKRREKMKENIRTLSDWSALLQDEINLIARLIDKDKPCLMCATYPMKRINGCHYHSVGSNSTIRFNLLNVWAGCHSCNSEKGGNINGYDTELIKEYGKEFWESIKFGLPLKYTYIGLMIHDIKFVLPEARKIARELKKVDLTYTSKQRIVLRNKYNERLGIYL
jgi:hypothetical protein